jgi:hypothetical protein
MVKKENSDDFLTKLNILFYADSALENLVRESKSAGIRESDIRSFLAAIKKSYDCLNSPANDDEEYSIKPNMKRPFEQNIEIISQFISNFSGADVEVKDPDMKHLMKAYTNCSAKSTLPLRF